MINARKPTVQGCRNGRFGKQSFCPSAENRWFWRKLAKIPILHSVHKNKGFCSSDPGIDENDENGGCHPSKMTVCQKHCFRHPELWSSNYSTYRVLLFWIIYRIFFFQDWGRLVNIYRNSRESTENKGWQSALRGTPRITGLAPVRIIYRKKKYRTGPFFEIIR